MYIFCIDIHYKDSQKLLYYCTKCENSGTQQVKMSNIDTVTHIMMSVFIILYDGIINCYINVFTMQKYISTVLQFQIHDKKLSHV